MFMVVISVIVGSWYEEWPRRGGRSLLADRPVDVVADPRGLGHLLRWVLGFLVFVWD